MIVKKSFGGTEVAFEPSIINGNVMVNATQMAKVFKKDVFDFLKNDTTQNFILECFKTDNSRFLGIKNKEDLIISKQKSGTWMHRVLALKFAAWLSPSFELWVYRTIDEILFAYSHEQDQSIQRAVILTHELKQLEKKSDKSGEDFERFIKLSNQLINERAIRANSTKSRFREFYRDLKPFFPTN
jgi:hypothetical protein